MRIMSFNQDGHHAICVLSANGPISNATVCQPASAGGTRTYEVSSLQSYFMSAVKKG